MTVRDGIYTELLKFDRKRWTVKEMSDRVEASDQVIRQVFNHLVEEDHMEHKKNSPYYYLQ